MLVFLLFTYLHNNPVILQNECKYVSLRDVVRVMILFKWFLEKLSTIDYLKKCLRALDVDDSMDIKVYDLILLA